MPVFSGQQTTHLQQRVVAVSTTPILRATSSAEYSPTTTTTPCTTGTHSGNGTRTTMMSSEQLPTAPFLDRTATAATHQQAPRSYQNQHHNHNQRRNATSLLLPPHSHSHSHSHANTSANTSANVNVNVNANARRTAQQTSLPLNESDDHVLPLSYDSSRSNGNNSNNNDPYHYNYHSDQAPRKPQRSVVRAAESGRGSLLPIRHTTTAKGSLSPTPQQRQHQHQQQRPVSPKPHQHHHHHQQQQLGRSQSQGLPRTQQDIVGEDNNNSNGNGNGKVVSKVGHLRRRTGGNVSSDDEFDAMATTSASTSNNGDSLYNGRSTGRRKRPGSSVSLNSMGNNSATNTNNHNNHHHHHNNNNNYSSSSSGREHPGPNSNYPGGGGGVAVCQKQLILIKLSRMKLGHLLQVVIVLAVVALVYESHHKALFATQQLTQFKDEESLLLLHLQKIEQQSIQLHENLGRLAQAHMENRNNGDNNNNNDGNNNNNNNDGANENDDNNKRNDLDDVTGNDREVDFDLIHKQTQQLYQMEEELSHEVQTLQKRIQLSARNHIIREFGEGPVQVVLELGFGNNGNERGHEHGHGHDDPSSSAVHKISILLWHDTPHAAWTWLEQIGNHLWDGAELHWQQGNIIETIPNEDRLADYYYAADRDRSSFGGGSSIGNSNGIEFVEQSQHAHQAWTVGVREHPVRTRDGSSSRNALGMYINLQDNSKLHTHEACVGKIIDGFDALQKILEATRSQHKNNGNGNANGNGKDGVGETSSSSSTVVIRKATAMHYVTKKAGMG